MTPEQREELERCRTLFALYFHDPRSPAHGDVNRAVRLVRRVESIGDLCCVHIAYHGVAHASYIELCRKGRLPPMTLRLPPARD